MKQGRRVLGRLRSFWSQKGRDSLEPGHQPSSSRELAFALDWRDQLKAQAMDVRVEVSESEPLAPELHLADQTVRINLSNAFAQAMGKPELRRTILTEAVEAARSGIGSAEDLPEVGKIVPVIKPWAWLESVPRTLAGTFAAGADVAVVLAEDSEHHVRYLRAADYDGLGKSFQELFVIAIENLRAAYPVFDEICAEHFVLPVCGGNFETSLLLDDKLIQKYEERFQGPVVCALLARDLFVVCRQNDEQGLAGIAWNCRMLPGEPFSQFLYQIVDSTIVVAGTLEELLERFPQHLNIGGELISVVPRGWRFEPPNMILYQVSTDQGDDLLSIRFTAHENSHRESLERWVEYLCGKLEVHASAEIFPSVSALPNGREVGLLAVIDSRQRRKQEHMIVPYPESKVLILLAESKVEHWSLVDEAREKVLAALVPLGAQPEGKSIQP